MDTENFKTSNLLNLGKRISPAVVPVLFIAIGYVDPGKWAATVEAGARFGSDLVLPMLVFNFAAILCQYLSARIAVITGKDLSQICGGEYDDVTCIFLGVVTELSMIALDLTMVLGTAQGLNLFFGVHSCTGVLVTVFDAVLFPVFANHLDNGKVKFLGISMAVFILLFYIIGVLFSQPEISMSATGMLTKLNGESAFMLMGLLGANIMPHNFYLHSSIVQQELGAPNASKGLMSHNHLFAILGMFSGIFLVNYVLMNAAANEFYSSGLVLLTFQDALQLMDQVFRSSTVPFFVLLVLFVSSQITASIRNHGRQAILHDFFGMDIPGWLHHATIRIVAILIAFYSAWNSGAEGIYQLLIVTQVAVALLVPSSVIPLFRVASSRSVMGVHKVSQLVEFIALTMFFGMLCLKIVFLVELIFGNSDWVGNLRLNVGSSMSLSYIVLLIIASTSFCLTLWLAAKPLKSASRLDPQLLNWDIKDGVSELLPYRGETNFSETRKQSMVFMNNEEPEITPENSLENYSDVSVRSTSNMSVRSANMDVPETLLVSDNTPHIPTIEERGPSMNCPRPVFHAGESPRTMQGIFVSTDCGEGSAGFVTVSTGSVSTSSVDTTVKVEGHARMCNDAEGENQETEESSKGVTETETMPSLTSEGPRSYRSISGKTDDCGSGAGSLSRLAGLGRAARRQLAAVLDEFWGQLFDFHGQATKEAKAMKLDLLLGLHSKDDDPKPATPVKVDTRVNEFPGFSSSPMSSSVFNSPNFHGVHASMETSYAVRSGSSFSHRMQLLDAYAQNSHNALDSGERRYSSLRLPPSSDDYDYQPATVHGYQLSSYIKSQIAKERLSSYSYGQTEPITPKSSTMGISSYIDPPGFTRPRKSQHGLSNMTPPGFSKPVVSRNSSLQSERPFNDLISALPAENLNAAVDEKKYCSMPDISGFSLPYKTSYPSDRRRDSHSGHGASLYPSQSMKAGAPTAVDHLSSSKSYRDPFTLQTSSSETGYPWSRQSGEQFGDKLQNTGGEGVGRKQSSHSPETMSSVNLEAKLLQSFRNCIVKLFKLEGSDWLFRQNDGADEDLIHCVAARERFLCEAETREINREVLMNEAVSSFERKPGSVLKNDGTDYTKFLVSSVPHCGESCVWRADLIISFGVWCIRRVLELSLLESRPELWGKYTYVLNRLQGIVDLAFSKPRMAMTPCFCLQIPVGRQQRSSPPISNGSLPPFARHGSGKCTTGSVLLDTIKDVEISLSFRKGRTGTAAGDVAFPKGKENLASVLKRYKRRLSTKPVGNHEGWSGSRKDPASVPYGL